MCVRWENPFGGGNTRFSWDKEAMFGEARVGVSGIMSLEFAA
jgi:hypothetical protein